MTNQIIVNIDTESDNSVEELRSEDVAMIVDGAENSGTPVSNDIKQEIISNDEQNIDKNELEDELQPLFKILFRNKEISSQYLNVIKNFLESLVCKKTNSKLEFIEEDLVLQIWDSSDKHISNSSNLDEYAMQFTLDKEPKIEKSAEVSHCGQSSAEILDGDEETKSSQVNSSCSPRIKCFNCLENHNMRDCPAPKNWSQIQKNKTNTKSFRTARYHVDYEQRFGHIVPGQLSENLLKALGVSKNAIPLHVYRMRIFGYPAGWLAEARLQHSGLTLINADGKTIADPTEEPGEIIAEDDRDQYDINKIFDFPGFNVPLPPNVYDEYRHYKVPKMSYQTSKDYMLRSLQQKKVFAGYKKMKLDHSTVSDKSFDPENVSDSLIEDISGQGELLSNEVSEFHSSSQQSLPSTSSKESMSEIQLSQETQMERETSETQEVLDKQEINLSEKKENITSSPRSISPSLTDLKNMKNQLLAELEDSSSQSNSEILSKPSTPQNNRLQSPLCTPNTSGSVKKVIFGTTVTQSQSPYSKLPSFDKFAHQIHDVINFENLPNTTGDGKIHNVIKKVRDTMSKISQE